MNDYEYAILARQDSEADQCSGCEYNPTVTGRDCYNDNEGCCECEVIHEGRPLWEVYPQLFSTPEAQKLLENLLHERSKTWRNILS